MSESPKSNIQDVALIFEGGSMRVSYTAAVVAKLIQQELWFDHMFGISAGSSHTVNYIARDAERARRSFVDLADDPNFGSWFTWLQGKGRFNSEYCYEHSSGPDQILPLDFDFFAANPADFHIAGFDADSGEEVWWSKADCPTSHDLAVRVRASSSMPILMPPTYIDDRMYVDGACGPNAGIPLHKAQAEGYERFFIVLSQPRDFVKDSDGPDLLFKTWLRQHPKVVDGLLARTERYDAIRAEIAELEAAGKAYVFYSDHIPYPNVVQNTTKLQANYDAGAVQVEQETPQMLEWLKPYIIR